MKISPLAVVDPKAKLADDVEVGPFCVIGPDVVVGAGTRIMNHVTLLGHTTLGKNNLVFPNAVIGTAPQDRKYRGAPTRVEIGDNNHIREAVTIQLGTEAGGGITRVGNSNLLMVNTHVGHDVQMGSNCTIANNVMLAGHVVIHDYVNMAGGVGIHHFVTVGEYAFLGGYSRIHHDVPPYVKIDGADTIRGINKVGLRRAGFTNEEIDSVEDACRRLWGKDKPFSVALAELQAEDGQNSRVRRMIEFISRRDLGRHGRYLESLRTK